VEWVKCPTLYSQELFYYKSLTPIEEWDSDDYSSDNFSDWSFDSDDEIFEPYMVQSDEVLVQDEPGTGQDVLQETVQFHEGSNGFHFKDDVCEGAFITGDIINDAQLSNYLSRPVRIANFNWLEANNINDILADLQPWYLFFSETHVADKINNFAYLRCDLHIKILLNASPFYYGACIAEYQPLQVFTPSTILDDGTSITQIPISQRPHVWLQPQKNEGAEMTLPFIKPTNWINIRDGNDFRYMGSLKFRPFTLLQSANGVTGTGVSIQVYAWAENVKLSGTTTAFAVQSDEYGTGPVSAPASYVAKVANHFKEMPIVGKWATATGIGASAVSSIAKLFGFTNVPVIENVMPYRPSAMPQLASTEIGYPTEKLTLDSKNELSVDPSIIGLSSEDPLAIANFATRESFIQRIDWSSSATVDTLLIQSRVNPNMFRTNSDSINAIIQFTPIAYAAQMFEHWRGDIIFRFEFQASAYHKGRVRISFDPQGNVTNNLANTTNSSNVVYTEIVDLAVHTSFELRVPYMQALPYLLVPQTQNTSDQPVSGVASFSVNPATDNGMITMRVLNTLTAPVASSSISILMFVRAADNFELANPTKINPNLTPFSVQSGEQKIAPPIVSTKMGDTYDTVDNARALVNFGETVVSMRPLLRRQVFTQAIAPTQTSGSRFGTLSYIFHKIPPYPGFDPAGMNTATAIIGTGTYNYNFTNMTPLTWLNLCFLGYRGSIQWHFNPIENTSVKSCAQMVSRIPFNPLNNTVTTVNSPYATTTNSGFASNMLALIPNSNSGAALTNDNIQTGLSIQTPNYSNYTFQSSSPYNATAPVGTGPTFDGSYYDVFNYTLLNTASTNQNTITSPTGVMIFTSIGTDYSPVYFLNCPSMRRQFNNPIPV
jgi:hypothetical protein